MHLHTHTHTQTGLYLPVLGYQLMLPRNQISGTFRSSVFSPGSVSLGQADVKTTWQREGEVGEEL